MSLLLKLYDLADELANEEEPNPDFPLIVSSQSTNNNNNNNNNNIGATTTDSFCNHAYSNLDRMELVETESKGKGWFAKSDIPAGTHLLVCKPVAKVMCWEEDEYLDQSDDDEDMNDDVDYENDDDNNNNNTDSTASMRNGLLAIRTVRTIQKQPSTWFSHLNDLFPRPHDMNSLSPWKCSNTTITSEFETAIKELSQTKPFSTSDPSIIQDIKDRLPLIVRYNCLSVETSPELFVHPNNLQGGHVLLSSTALYTLPSYFNHNYHPNVARFSVGDISFFVTNQFIPQGTELCISYIESELLCENAQRRTALLEMDFSDKNDDGQKDSPMNDSPLQTNDDEDNGPVVDVELQNELMDINPLDRVGEIQSLLDQASNYINQGKGSVNNDDNNDECEDIAWYKCDVHQLKMLLALTFDSLGQFSKALCLWEQCIEFIDTNFPPGDENGIPVRVQAALCAAASGDSTKAKEYAIQALNQHALIFGGGVALFRRRYAKELELKLRPKTSRCLSGQEALDQLWPMTTELK
jgi:tetratricopeptide (TPR) repeat protein